MFGMKDRERALYERLLAERERLIVALSDQVDWHRAAAGTVVKNHLTEPQAAELSDQDAAFQQLLEGMQLGDPNAMHMSEDEEELMYALRHGADPEQIAQALEQVHGVRELPFDPE